MLAIINVTKDDTQELDDYEIRINRRVIGTFQHKRTYRGAAQCLRDAADALDQAGKDADMDALMAIIENHYGILKEGIQELTSE